MSIHDLIPDDNRDKPGININGDEKYKSEDWLREQYIGKDRSLADIAKECEVHYSTIGNWRDKFSLNRETAKREYTSKDWLREQYITKDRSQSDISRECDVSNETIRRWINRFGLNKGNKCPICGYKSVHLGQHFIHSDHGFPDIDQHRWEILVGHIMGDATYAKRSKNGYLAWNMTNLQYMKWLNNELGWISYDVRKGSTPEKMAQYHFLRDRETSDSYKDEQDVWPGSDDSYKQQYRGSTISHPWIDKLDWMEDGKKKFPKTVKLTPTVVKIWFSDDGGLHWGNGNRPQASITATSQIDILDLLSDKFSDAVCSPNVIRNRLQFNVDETEELIDWMGEAPPGMEYKFCLESKERYNELKP